MEQELKSIMNIKSLFGLFMRHLNVPIIKKSQLSKKSKVLYGTFLYSSSIGNYSYIGKNCTVVNTKIGNFCSIADDCIIGGASHPIDWLSTSPVFCSGKNILKSKFSNHKYEPYLETKIGNDVWIGSRCLIKGGICIGDGSILGMGSVLTKSIGDYEVWAGNPARFIKYRFDEEIIKTLKKTHWWSFTDSKVALLAVHSNDISKAVDYLIKDDRVVQKEIDQVKKREADGK